MCYMFASNKTFMCCRCPQTLSKFSATKKLQNPLQLRTKNLEPRFFYKTHINILYVVASRLKTLIMIWWLQHWHKKDRKAKIENWQFSRSIIRNTYTKSHTFIIDIYKNRMEKAMHQHYVVYPFCFWIFYLQFNIFNWLLDLQWPHWWKFECSKETFCSILFNSTRKPLGLKNTDYSI